MIEHGLPIADYFAAVATGDYSARASLELNLLDEASSKSLTEQFGFHPVVSYLDGLVLDDCETSNHHILVRRHPLRGQILYLAHDGESRVVYENLAAMLAAADRARLCGIALSETHPEISPRADDQDALSNMIREFLADEEIELVLMLVPSMSLKDEKLLSELASHDDFYVVEALAGLIAKRPSEDLREIAQRCAAHPHPQAAGAGLKAVRAFSRGR
ncbi:MAG TPA: hypothetical protein VGE64_03155 [Xanthomonadaceae bacterium]